MSTAPSYNELYPEAEQQAFKEALAKTYASIKEAKRLIEDQEDGPLTMRAQMDAIRQQVKALEETVDSLHWAFGQAMTAVTWLDQERGGLSAGLAGSVSAAYRHDARQ